MKQSTYVDAEIWRWLALTTMLAAGGGLGWGLVAAEAESRQAPPAAPREPLTLGEAIRSAVAGNPDLRAACARMDAAAGRAQQARVWPNPELELSAEDWPVSGGGRGIPDAKQLVGVAQTVPFPGKKGLDGKIGAASLRANEAEARLRVREVVRDVKVAFYHVLAAERLAEVQEDLVCVAESLASTARKRVAAGAAADQEQLRAEIALEQAKTELAGFCRETLLARQTLAMVIGRPELKAAPLSGRLAEAADPALLDQGPETWLSEHPGLAGARASRDRAELELRRARLDPYPDVKVGLAGGRIGETGESIIQLGFSVPLPIIDRGKGKQREALANVLASEAELASIEQRLRRDWGMASQRLRTAAAQVEGYRDRIMPRANDALRLVQTGFEQGKFGFIDLLDTQRTTAEVRLNYQQRLLELNVAQAELEALLKPQPNQPATTK